MQQFPSAFEFTEIYLTALWDSVTLGIFRNFMHSGSVAQHKSDHSKHRLSVWNWENQFDEDTVALFCNPLYQVSVDEKGFEGQSQTFPSRVCNEVSCRWRHTGHSTARSLPTSLSTSVIQPRHHVPDLQMWSLCYLRWLTPLQVVDGGSAAELTAQFALLTEIRTLQHDIVLLSEEHSLRPMPHPQHDKPVMSLPQRVSSSYPFVACQPSRQTSQTAYCAASSLQLSYIDDSISVDELSITDIPHPEPCLP